MNVVNIDQGLSGIRILLAGAGGQLGVAMQQCIPESVELIALDRATLDITDHDAVSDAVRRFRPDWVINAAAYTAVDKAESEIDIAFAINRDGAANLAQAAAGSNARMVHISTDYVFDGKQARPYLPDDTVNPINVYGESKLAGEVSVREVLGEEALILRTAWVYAPHGKNFLTTMLKLMKELGELKVVEDQIGSPTSVYSLANGILAAIANKFSGTHHWTDAGITSWYDFACAINEYAATTGTKACNIYPIPTSDYPTPAKRPSCAVLDKQSMRNAIGYHGVQWKDALRGVMERLQHSSLSP